MRNAKNAINPPTIENDKIDITIPIMIPIQQGSYVIIFD